MLIDWLDVRILAADDGELLSPSIVIDGSSDP
jgi:hypothetical protein